MLEQIAICLHTLPLTEDSRFIVGVSGGADSVVLLYALRQLGINCLAVHCNFRLRGQESQRDEQFVRAFCESNSVELIVADFETERYATEHKISIEMAARELRYSLFDTLAEKHGCDYIAVAHHRDDQIETVFLNMLRGCGMRGVAGMKFQNGKVIRPLLSVSRGEIETFASAHALGYITDSSNLKSIYKRNKIRLDLLPLLEEISPGAKDTLERTIQNLNDAEHYYNDAVAHAKRRVVSEGVSSSGCFKISIELLLKEHSPRTILFELLSPLGFNRSSVETILSALDAISGTQFLSKTHRVVKDRDQLFIAPLNRALENVYFISKDQRALTVPLKLRVDISSDVTSPISNDKRVAMLDLDRLKFPLVLRHWQRGDKMVPLGMKGSKKISDIFTNLKYAIPQKEEAWLLCSGHEIVWLVGERISERFKVTEKTTHIYKLYIE
ncbi:MAG: tRNA lysidine(34) synthetase TilS [Bacteroidales bacterium]